ncbi:cytochrome P450 82C4 [Amborella trichopoda]|uniref:cytochrome P450 82C4 n=1 Tax=Amborella trichopoda TaxID=13333 RepID=UPI0009BF2C13|nr:cytochrome P450 82C4 [Amborella trichopoda]|eukprot:XP_020519547.1 cytochrome P450 82C4 [Amborella trichopoda]
MKLQMGQKSTLVVSDADIARECLTIHDRAFASRPMMAAGRILGFDYTAIAWALYGPLWRDLRKVCTLELLSTRCLETLSHVRDGETANCIKRLYSVLRLGPEEEVMEFKELVEESFYVSGLPNLGDVMPVRQGVDVDREKATDFLDVMLSLSDDPQIASLSASTPHRRDIIIKATLLVIVFAATNTSAMTLEWALASLLSNPEAMRKVKEEHDTKIGKERRVEEADIANLPYLQAIIKDTLRLYPPGPLLVPHESIEDCVVAGFHMPAGTRLLMNAWKIQRDPRWWQQPLKFELERFIGSEVDVKGQHFQLLPFGAGRRACPGMSRALSVVHLALARLLHSFDWHLPLGCSSLDMTEVVGLTTPRASPLEALMEPRLPLELLCKS